LSIFSILILLIIATVISLALMAIILMSWENKEEEICYPIQRKDSSRLLRNQEGIDFANTGKSLQIISQNEIYTSIVMPCDSLIVDEQGDTFSIEGPYVLNCNESRTFNYIDILYIFLITFLNFPLIFMYYLCSRKQPLGVVGGHYEFENGFYGLGRHIIFCLVQFFDTNSIPKVCF
jgi:hypothetical protein